MTPLTRIPSSQKQEGILVLLFSGTNSLFLRFRQRLHQLTAEIGDVCHHAPPDQIPLAKGRLVYPGSTRIEDIILDSERAGRLTSLHDAGGYGDQSTVANDANRFSPGIHIPHQI